MSGKKLENKLAVRNLTISFKTDNGLVRAVRNVNFDLYKGETLAIVGESGSGKSVSNRAIIGILANNAIVESGEIIYDGQDLLKISEEEFQKIRGDKISMIFQDPMSSLNPIMKVGKQLTEAMLLKSAASRRNARSNFNSKLKLMNTVLNKIDEGSEEKIASNNHKCKTFDDFCIKSTRLENVYNETNRVAVVLKSDIDNWLFLASKNQPLEVVKILRSVINRLPHTYHPYVLVKTDSLTEDLKVLSAAYDKYSYKKVYKNTKETFKDIKNLFKSPKVFDEDCVNALQRIADALDVAINRPKPNYFTLGYYALRNPEANISDIPIEELNEITRKYIDEEYMLDFIDLGAKALEFNHRETVEKKKSLLSELESATEYFSRDGLIQKEAVKYAKELNVKVDGAIDRLIVRKNPVEFTFHSSILSALNEYFTAIKQNPKELARFNKQQAKYDKIVAKGKTPDWKVVPASTVDLEVAKQNIILVLKNLIASYSRAIEADSQFDSTAEMISVIDYLKEQASLVVYKVTKSIAKAKALKLLEEVGISEPQVRYNQYPFEFSGGMRQRIVIAIALAANPDILICDEPTTALDVTIQSQILELINRIKAERHLSVIFITHDLGVVANMADRIAVMYAGKIVEYGTADDVFYDPRHPYTWALLSSMPDLDTKEKLEAIPGTPPNMIYPPKGDAFAARNKYALQIDFKEQPPMFKVSDTHYAATWLLHPDAPKVDPPKIVTDRIARMLKEDN